MNTIMITAHNALSIRRRGSSRSGTSDPVRSFAIAMSTSLAGAVNSFEWSGHVVQRGPRFARQTPRRSSRSTPPR